VATEALAEQVGRVVGRKQQKTDELSLYLKVERETINLPRFQVECRPEAD